MVEANVTSAESAPQALLTLGGSDLVYQWRPLCRMGQDRQRNETGKPPTPAQRADPPVPLPPTPTTPGLS